MKKALHSGFTLIELLLYTGILIMLVAVVGSTLLAFSKTYRSIASEQSIEQSAEGILGRMVREVRNAKTIDSSNSTLGTSPGVLSLNTTDATGNAETIGFFITGGILHLKKNGTDTGPLMPSAADVSNLVFRSISAGNTTAIKIELTLESGTSTAYRSRSFYETAVLRGSYLQ